MWNSLKEMQLEDMAEIHGFVSHKQTYHMRGPGLTGSIECKYLRLYSELGVHIFSLLATVIADMKHASPAL